MNKSLKKVCVAVLAIATVGAAAISLAACSKKSDSVSLDATTGTVTWSENSIATKYSVRLMCGDDVLATKSVANTETSYTFADVLPWGTTERMPFSEVYATMQPITTSGTGDLVKSSSVTNSKLAAPEVELISNSSKLYIAIDPEICFIHSTYQAMPASYEYTLTIGGTTNNKSVVGSDVTVTKAADTGTGETVYTYTVKGVSWDVTELLTDGSAYTITVKAVAASGAESSETVTLSGTYTAEGFATVYSTNYNQKGTGTYGSASNTSNKYANGDLKSSGGGGNRPGRN